MERKYTHIKGIEKEVFKLKEDGYTNKEIAERYNVTLKQIKNLINSSIIAYKTGTEQTVNLVLNTVKAAMKKEKVTEQLQLHSDQGAQYASHEYFNLTQLYNITPSMSRKGNPYDNALAENFFSILKTECIHGTKIKTFAEAKQLIDDFIYFYNHQRVQLKTKLTPLELRSQFVT